MNNIPAEILSAVNALLARTKRKIRRKVRKI